MRKGRGIARLGTGVQRDPGAQPPSLGISLPAARRVILAADQVCHLSQLLSTALGDVVREIRQATTTYLECPKCDYHYSWCQLDEGLRTSSREPKPPRRCPFDNATLTILASIGDCMKAAKRAAR